MLSLEVRKLGLEHVVSLLGIQLRLDLDQLGFVVHLGDGDL